MIWYIKIKLIKNINKAPEIKPRGPDPLATPATNPIKPPIIAIQIRVNTNGLKKLFLGSLILLSTQFHIIDPDDLIVSPI